MLCKKFASFALLGSLAIGPMVGCESLPGNDEQQGAVIGGVGGALAGAAVSKDNRGLGALIGGALGAGGGYLIGAKKDKITGKDNDRSREEAIRASERAERNPASANDVTRSRSADLNEDGFVTLDEVVAMERAGLDDREQVARLERTQQVFELTAQQERYLEDRGVSREVVREMRSMNQDYDTARTASTSDRIDRIERNDRLDRTDRVNDLDRRDDSRIDRIDRIDSSTGGYDRERNGAIAR